MSIKLKEPLFFIRPNYLEPMTGIEPVASSLPRTRSTPELHRHNQGILPLSFIGLKMSGRRDSNPRPQPWKGCALPTELLPRNECVFVC